MISKVFFFLDLILLVSCVLNRDSFDSHHFTEVVGEHTATIIFLHGLGDTGDGWFQQISSYAKANPGVKIICPTAPVSPVTLNGGYPMTSWHDIVSLDSIDSESFRGLSESVTTIHNLINTASKEVPTNRIILGGFSQGAALSMYAGLQYPEKLGGIVAMSGYLPHFEIFEQKINAANKETKVFIAHGTADQVVKFQAGQLAFETLHKIIGDNAVFKKYGGLGHSSSPQELRDVFAFFSTSLQRE